jgi:hypothetical protein
LKKVNLIIGIVLIAIVLYYSFNLYTNSKENAVSPEDISIEATFKLIENEKMAYKDIMVDVTVHQEKNSRNIMIFPVGQGLEGMTFDNGRDDGLFRPGSIGTGYKYAEIAISELKKSNIIHELESNNDSSLIGFHLPDEAGDYKLNIYFDEGEDFTGLDEMYLVYVHIEEKAFWKDVQWAKIVKIVGDHN